MVVQVRSYLTKGKFTQSPCLECASHNADKPFICGSGNAPAPAPAPALALTRRAHA